jgi:hypothetical protein
LRPHPPLDLSMKAPRANTHKPRESNPRQSKTQKQRIKNPPPLGSTTLRTKVRRSFEANFCAGVSWMVKHLMEMDEFNVGKLNNDKLQKFFDFLENHDYIKFFVWLNEKLDVELSYDSAPKFFGKPAYSDDF